jgi:CRISPR-associated protein Csx17
MTYLKAIGVFRIIAEQCDSQATCWWEDEVFRIATSLSQEELFSFFLNEYRPAPVLAPWTGSSGFYPGDNTEILDAFLSSDHQRFTPYKTAIDQAWLALKALGLTMKEKKVFKEQMARKKSDLLRYLRNTMCEEALAWLDAAFLLTSGNPKYPPLLGTGGNDGRFDFTTNFMQRVDLLFCIATGEARPDAAAFLDHALYDTKICGMHKKAIGQFHPGFAGGKNMGASFEADSLNNPWDFLLTIEGTLLFAASGSRRLNSSDKESLSYPFCVRSSAAAYESASDGDENNTRAEFWTPLWLKACRLPELKFFLSEGRAQLGRRNAVRGADFARALSTLGIDRGIEAFNRFGFQERNGQAYLAVHLGHWKVRERPLIHLLNECHGWVERYRRCASAKTAPRRLVSALRNFDDALMRACKEEQKLTGVLIALGRMEQALVHSPRAAVGSDTMPAMSPLPKLSSRWIQAADDGSIEFRLACALASIRDDEALGPLRCNMMPCDPQRPWTRYDAAKMDQPQIVWTHGTLTDNLIAVLQRRCLDGQRNSLAKLPLSGACPLPLSDIISFILGQVDERKIERLLWGLNALRWKKGKKYFSDYRTDPLSLPLPPAYALFKLTHCPEFPESHEAVESKEKIPLDPSIMALAGAGRVEATRMAARRLNASGWKSFVRVAPASADQIKRCAAAVLFPLKKYDLRKLTGRLSITAQESISDVPEAENKTIL